MSTVTITAADVNKLRIKTGAGMMDCKKALTETNGDFEAAIDYLRKKGAKVSASRSDREAKEGVVIAKTTTDGKKGIIIELNCETDFVAKNADFVQFAQSVAALAIEKNPVSLEALLDLELNGTKLSEAIIEQTGKIGEKIGVSKFEKVEAPKVVAYIHANYKLGVLVGLSADAQGVEEAGRDVSMQIAAMNPLAIDETSIAPETIAREREIAIEQIKAEGKPAEMAEKIAVGKVNKFFKDNTLLAQAFVKDNSKSVADYLKSVSADLKVTEFKRVALG